MSIGINWAEVWGPVWAQVWAQSAPEPEVTSTTRAAGRKPIQWVHIRVDDEELIVEPEEIPQAIEIAVRKIKPGQPLPKIEVSGPIPKAEKRDIRSEIRRRAMDNLQTRAVMTILRWDREDEEDLQWLI